MLPWISAIHVSVELASRMNHANRRLQKYANTFGHLTAIVLAHPISPHICSLNSLAGPDVDKCRAGGVQHYNMHQKTLKLLLRALAQHLGHLSR